MFLIFENTSEESDQMSDFVNIYAETLFKFILNRFNVGESIIFHYIRMYVL